MNQAVVKQTFLRELKGAALNINVTSTETQFQLLQVFTVEEMRKKNHGFSGDAHPGHGFVTLH